MFLKVLKQFIRVYLLGNYSVYQSWHLLSYLKQLYSRTLTNICNYSIKVLKWTRKNVFLYEFRFTNCNSTQKHKPPYEINLINAIRWLEVNINYNNRRSLKTIVICRDLMRSLFVMKPHCKELRRASNQATLDVSNKTQNESVIIYSKHKALYSIMVMISCESSFIVSMSTYTKRWAPHNLFAS